MIRKNNKQIWTKRIRWFSLAFGFLFGLIAYLPWLESGITNLNTEWDVLYYTLKLITGAVPLEGTLSSNEGLWKGLMLVARFLCPTNIAVFLLSFFSESVEKAFLTMRSWRRELTIGKRRFFRDSVAIYGDNDLVTQAADGTHFIQAGAYFLKNAKKHIIILDNDDDSLSFYKQHEKELSKDITYIGLQQMASFLMKSIPNVSYFNVFEEVARVYWKEHNLRAAIEDKPEYQIVILGYCRDNLGYQLLKYGILNNIFRKDQKITYHIFCKPEEAVRGFECLHMMSEDTIEWHTEQWQRRLPIIQSANRILLCRSINPHILNQLLLVCTNQEIHYYDPDIASYPEKYAYRYMHAFGCTKKVLNENSMLKSALFHNAMDRHFLYVTEYGTEEEKAAIRTAAKKGTAATEALKLKYWNGLSGLLKNSNIATSDYYSINPVASELTAEGIESRAELEHIRWCRFHFLCGWQYGIPENGARKDPEKRIHRDLVLWCDLPEIEKEKDRQQVEMEGQSANDT